MSGVDDALDTLLLPFETRQLQWSDDAMFMRARYGASLSQIADERLTCVQSFKPEAEILRRAGFKVSPSIELSSRKYSLILMLPPRQRDEARALFAQAISMLKPEGVVIASAGNNEGARSLESDLEKLCGNVHTLSKNKCRVFWSSPSEHTIDATLLSDWSTGDLSRPILNGRYISRPGIFAWDRIDIASALLAQNLPIGLSGSAADLGAGFGFLSDALLERCQSIVALDVYEAEHRALELAQTNLAQYQSRLPIEYHWHDVTAGLNSKYDIIITNPPFHTQASIDRPDIGRRFITVAGQSLKPGGQLWLVANRHLPYEQVLVDGFDSVNVVTQQQGFKIIVATRSAHEIKRPRK